MTVAEGSSDYSEKPGSSFITSSSCTTLARYGFREILAILNKICGGGYMGNVIVGAAMWSRTGSAKFLEQEKREQAISIEHWGGFHKTTRLFSADRNAAIRTITHLLTRYGYEWTFFVNCHAWNIQIQIVELPKRSYTTDREYGVQWIALVISFLGGMNP